jgi:cytochrome c oxidase assembly factor CtaG
VNDALQSLLGGWYAEPVPLIAAAGAVLLYDRGARRLTAIDPPRAPSRVQKVLLASGVAVILVALLSPIDQAALRLQWVHMVQHMLLLVVAAPLIVLARPWRTGLAGLSPRLRRLLAAPGAWAGRSHGRQVTVAAVAVAGFVGVLWLWHVPALYDLTLRNEAAHNLEHTAFLAVGLAFWTAAIPRTATPSLGQLGQSVVSLVGLVGSWMLAVYIGYSPQVLYAYAGSGSLSASADQQIAAGVMWVPASVPFVAVLVVLAVRWFELDARSAAAELRARREASV